MKIQDLITPRVREIVREAKDIKWPYCPLGGAAQLAFTEMIAEAERRGWRLMPVEATDEMVQASSYQAYPKADRECNPDALHLINLVMRSVAQDQWRAAVAAAPKVE